MCLKTGVDGGIIVDVIEEIRALAEEYEACARIKGWAMYCVQLSILV